MPYRNLMKSMWYWGIIFQILFSYDYANTKNCTRATKVELLRKIHLSFRKILGISVNNFHNSPNGTMKKVPVVEQDSCVCMGFELTRMLWHAATIPSSTSGASAAY